MWERIKEYTMFALGGLAALIVIAYNIQAGWIWFLR